MALGPRCKRVSRKGYPFRNIISPFVIVQGRQGTQVYPPIIRGPILRTRGSEDRFCDRYLRGGLRGVHHGKGGR